MNTTPTPTRSTPTCFQSVQLARARARFSDFSWDFWPPRLLLCCSVSTMPPPQLSEPLLSPSPIVGPSRSDVPPVLLMVLSELLLASVNTVVKFVHGWPSQRLMLVRFSIDFCLCAAACVLRGHGAPLTSDIVTLCLRGLAYCVGVTFFWAALRSCMPIGDVVVLLLAMSPLFLVLLSRLLLGEVIPREWPAQMCLLVIGAILINKPLALADDCPPATALLPACAAVSWAFMNFASRRVKHIPSVQVMLVNDIVAISFAVLSAYVTLGSDDAAAALTPPWDRNCALVAVSAVLGWTGLMCNVKGYQTVSVAAIATIAGATSIPFNYAFQIFVFHEPLDAFSIAGASLVLATTIGMIVIKHIVASKANAPSATDQV